MVMTTTSPSMSWGISPASTLPVPFSHLTEQPVVGLLVSADGSCGGRRVCLPRHGVVGVPSPLPTVEEVAERLLFSGCPFVRSLRTWFVSFLLVSL